MRVKAVEIEKYQSDKGLKLTVSPTSVWQFLVTEGGVSFLEWLTPTKEYVKPSLEVKPDLFSLFDMMAKETSEGVSVSKESVPFAINESVIALGVSLEESKQDATYLKSLDVPVYVACDLRGLSLEDMQDWVSTFDYDTDFIYVLDLDLSYTDISSLITTLKDSGIGEEVIRLVGDKVFKYKGQNYCGLFSPFFVRRFNLEWLYDSTPHYASQVILAKDSTEVIPIEDCTYKRG